MIRLSTFVGLALASVAAGLVMHVSYRVQRTEAYLAKLEREIVREQDQIRVLDAEWSYLNDPARIEALARRHLLLGPMSVKKIVSLDAIPLRDPNSVVAPGPLVIKAPPAPLKPTDRAGDQRLEPVAPPTIVAERVAPPAASAQLAVVKSPSQQPAPTQKLSAKEAAAAATRAAAEAAARMRTISAKSDPIGALAGGAR
ncbi:cell division protein FtsL [Roseiterribacter gracilis]|uniref:Cell division protein FtsL n=1 Tax=Roseiterribacter gracilis TaxID=2812848 RepID=A0A8S8XF59_9PROT|nr:hypothetical protein TMPK1_20120 [Rhodospirillales bacterium TMPK1]